ncbi:MAG: hypothetical protein Q7J84_17490 [Sulfuricaulis sp.]|nr:hypothetical protein [Sulfuricaulis sp.]
MTPSLLRECEEVEKRLREWLEANLANNGWPTRSMDDDLSEAAALLSRCRAELGKAQSARETFGWWDHFNCVFYSDKDSADKASAGGNKITPLYAATDEGRKG